MRIEITTGARTTESSMFTMIELPGWIIVMALLVAFITGYFEGVKENEPEKPFHEIEDENNGPGI